MLGIGRVIYGIYGSKLNINKILIWGSFGATICYITVALSPFPALSIIACALCGFFVSLLWPGTLVVTSSSLPLAGASLFALLAASGDIGASIGPWFAGTITDFATNKFSYLTTITSISAEQLGLRISILVSAIFPFLAMICFWLLLENKKRTCCKMKLN